MGRWHDIRNGLDVPARLSALDLDVRRGREVFYEQKKHPIPGRHIGHDDRSALFMSEIRGGVERSPLGQCHSKCRSGGSAQQWCSRGRRASRGPERHPPGGVTWWQSMLSVDPLGNPSRWALRHIRRSSRHSPEPNPRALIPPIESRVAPHHLCRRFAPRKSERNGQVGGAPSWHPSAPSSRTGKPSGGVENGPRGEAQRWRERQRHQESYVSDAPGASHGNPALVRFTSEPVVVRDVRSDVVVSPVLPWGVDEPDGDGVDGDSVASEVQGEGTAEACNCCSSCADRRHPRVRVACCRCGQCDDPRPIGTPKMRSGRCDKVQHAAELAHDLRLPLGDREIQGPAMDTLSGDGRNAVEPSEPLDGGSHERLHGPGVRDIRRHGQTGRRVECRSGMPQSLVIAGASGDYRPFSQEGGDARQPDPRTASGDDDRSTGQAQVHACLCSRVLPERCGAWMVRAPDLISDRLPGSSSVSEIHGGHPALWSFSSRRSAPSGVPRLQNFDGCRGSTELAVGRRGPRGPSRRTPVVRTPSPAPAGISGRPREHLRVPVMGRASRLDPHGHERRAVGHDR